MFHFFGVENDSLRVREAINKMVEKGRIGNFSLVSTHYSLHQEPGLVLQVRAICCTRRGLCTPELTLIEGKIYFSLTSCNYAAVVFLLKFINSRNCFSPWNVYEKENFLLSWIGNFAKNKRHSRPLNAQCRREAHNGKSSAILIILRIEKNYNWNFVFASFQFVCSRWKQSRNHRCVRRMT